MELLDLPVKQFLALARFEQRDRVVDFSIDCSNLKLLAPGQTHPPDFAHAVFAQRHIETLILGGYRVIAFLGLV